MWCEKLQQLSCSLNYKIDWCRTEGYNFRSGQIHILVGCCEVPVLFVLGYLFFMCFNYNT